MEWQALSSTLERVFFDPLAPDSFIWTPVKNGVFSVKSFKQELTTKVQKPQLPPLKQLWTNLVPHRVEIFTWFAILGKLNTCEKLVIRLGIIPAQDINCVLCGEAPEKSIHLFLHCMFSSTLWSWWLSMWQTSWVFPLELRDAFIQWRTPISNPFFKKVWSAIFS